MSTSKALTISTFLLLIILFPTASPLSFNITPITFSDRYRFNFSGDASAGDGIPITAPDRSQVKDYSIGRVTYHEPLHLWDNSSGNLTDFSTHFSFVIDSAGQPNSADGMAFFLAPLNSSLRDGTAGGGLGLGSGEGATGNTSSSSFVAVEFDTYMNSFDPPPFWTMNYPHVGIDINSMRSLNQTAWRNDVSKGYENDAWISYNATTKMLVVEFTGVNNSFTQRGRLVYEVDLRTYLPEFVAVGFSAATGTFFEQHVIKSWSFSSTLHLQTPSSPPSSSSSSNNKWLVLGLSAGIISAFILTSVFAVFLLRKRKKKEVVGEDDSLMDNEFEHGTGPRKFSYEELAVATNNFSDNQKLGEGGFGGVYRGFLASTKTEVAVKKVKKGSKQGYKEYASEVKIISQLGHMNLVQLMGWCHQRSELLLVYEFMPNNSLDSHLFTGNSLLTWEMRYRIAQGLASALLYLHEELKQYVVHRDIKSSNVMLDSNFTAKLGDFGLARLVDHDKNSQTTIPAGTIGYMAPEYPSTGRASKETDIYSFGIVLLEIACGRRPIEYNLPQNQIVLVEWVWSLYGGGRLLDGADPKLDLSEHDVGKIERLMVVGLWCVHPDSSQRPSIRQVIQVLNCEAAMPVLPQTMPKPFYDILIKINADSTSDAQCSHSSNLTVNSSGSTSDLLPR